MRRLITVLAGLTILAAPTAAHAQPKPKTVSLAQFRKLQWLSGTWRGTGGGLTAFYEAYHVVNDSTIGVRAYADSTLRVVSDSSWIEWRHNTAQRRSARSIAVAVALSDTSVHFVRQGKVLGAFKFTRLSANQWRAQIYAANGAESVYFFERVKNK